MYVRRYILHSSGEMCKAILQWGTGEAVPSRTNTLAIPQMPRQSYSEAVKIDRRSGFLFYPEVFYPLQGEPKGGVKTIEEDREGRWLLS